MLVNLGKSIKFKFAKLLFNLGKSIKFRFAKLLFNLGKSIRFKFAKLFVFIDNAATKFAIVFANSKLKALLAMLLA